MRGSEALRVSTTMTSETNNDAIPATNEKLNFFRLGLRLCVRHSALGLLESLEILLSVSVFRCA